MHSANQVSFSVQKLSNITFGQTPLSHLTVGDGRQHVFSFRLLGYEDTKVSMLLLRDGVVTGVLKPLPASADAGAP